MMTLIENFKATCLCRTSSQTRITLHSADLSYPDLSTLTSACSMCTPVNALPEAQLACDKLQHPQHCLQRAARLNSPRDPILN